MSRHVRTWVVAADSARARLYLHDHSEEALRPAELAGLPPLDDRVQSHTEKSDRAGRSHGSSNDGVRHAIESHSDYRKLEKQKFSIALADALNHARLHDEFDRLVLVAPPRSIGELRRHLSVQVQSAMEVIAKDLTKAPVEILWDHVAGAVQRPKPVQPA